MQIIPVIDIKDGIVVHAKQGNRADYLPIQSTLCRTADVFDVINALRLNFNSDIFYVADLNAITQQGSNTELITKLLQTYTDISFWLDAGYPLPNEALHHFKNCIPVLGSESFTENTVHNIEKYGKNFVLSLDFAQSGPLGASTLFEQTDYWPANIIIMTLAKVGSNSGPDFALLSHYRSHYPDFNFIASGGIRDYRDLIRLKKMGIQQALVATALHNGKLSALDVADLQVE